MQDFTILKFIELVDILIEKKYSFKKVEDYFKIVNNKYQNNVDASLTLFLTLEEIKNQRIIILRHDVDARPQNALHFARIQSSKEVFGTYYFRTVSQSYDESIIKEIYDLGHEIGYHYETMDSNEGNVIKAYDEFCRNLDKFRKIVPINTISMHGSPMSKYDNRTIWEEFDYRILGIISEPYLDMNFNEIFYLTDTGRCWDGHLYNIRDKATKEKQVTNNKFLKLRYHKTNDLINAIRQDVFPKQSMLNFHPQRWNSEILPWIEELCFQSMKNLIKYILIISKRK